LRKADAPRPARWASLRNQPFILGLRSGIIHFRRHRWRLAANGSIECALVLMPIKRLVTGENRVCTHSDPRSSHSRVTRPIVCLPKGSMTNETVQSHMSDRPCPVMREILNAHNRNNRSACCHLQALCGGPNYGNPVCRSRWPAANLLLPGKFG
jgi:hypothetical protein